MRAPSPRTRRVLAGVVALLLVSGASLAYLRQGATVVTVDDAIERFRSTSTTNAVPESLAAAAAVEPDTDAAAAAVAAAGASAPDQKPAAAAGGRAPAPVAASAAAAPAAATAEPTVPTATARTRASEGVYTYDTSGYEATNAVGGARHDYPANTAITVRHNECGGFVMRWQPLDERWDESDLCLDAGGVAIRRFTTFHEFFRQRQTQEFLCDPGTHVHRPAAAAGESWNWTCKAGSSGFATTVTFVGIEDISIGGQTRRAARIFYDSVMTGANRGTQKQERWVDPDTGLLFKMTTDIDTEADSPFGAVRYEERYTLTLASLTPRT